MLCRDAACRVSPDKEAASQHPARLVKFQSWIAREQLARIAVAQITQEVRFPFTVRKELRIHLRGIKAGHRATIKSHGPSRKNKVASLPRAIAECGFIDQRLVSHEIGAHVGVRK